MNKKVLAIHLLNDCSGSTRIFHDALLELSSCGYDLHLLCGKQANGLLSKLDIPTTTIVYRRSETSKLLNLVFYLYSQIQLIFAFYRLHKNKQFDIVYVNTLLPFGALFFGKLLRIPVIQHIHEVGFGGYLLTSFLFWSSRLCASRRIFVSPYQAELIAKSKSRNNVVIENPISKLIREHSDSSHYRHFHHGYFNVLMVSSYRAYKGVSQFIKVVKALLPYEHIRFHFLLNESDAQTQKISRQFQSLTNLLIYPRTPNPSPYYKKASLNLNLSTPDWIETFGLTIVESMCFGVPSIVPPRGHPAQLVDDGFNGLVIDSLNTEQLASTILSLSFDHKLCLHLSQNAQQTSSGFDYQSFRFKLDELFRSC